MATEKTVEVMDLSDFFCKLLAAKTEKDACDLLDKTPEFFQAEIWLLLDAVPALNRVQDLRNQIKEWSKQIILNYARESREGANSFYDWLSGIPLLPIHITKPLQDEYRACAITYENFSDCYAGFDEKSFYDNALREIENWVNLW